MNNNYFLAISVRVNGNKGKRYFVGAVTCAPDKIKYDLRVVEKHELIFEYRLKSASVSKFNIFAFPNKDGVKAFHKALREYFGGKRALLAWIHTKLEKLGESIGLSVGERFEIDYFNILTGEVLQ